MYLSTRRSPTAEFRHQLCEGVFIGMPLRQLVHLVPHVLPALEQQRTKMLGL